MEQNTVTEVENLHHLALHTIGTPGIILLPLHTSHLQLKGRQGTFRTSSPSHSCRRKRQPWRTMSKLKQEHPSLRQPRKTGDQNALQIVTIRPAGKNWSFFAGFSNVTAFLMASSWRTQLNFSIALSKSFEGKALTRQK